MRITGGELRSRRIETSHLRGVRPTTDRVRESLFNIIEHAVVLEDATVLDMFGGSGILSFESLSRGARACYCVEKHRGNAKSIAKAAQTLNLQDTLTVLCKDATKIVSNDIDSPLSLAFLDPPYSSAVLDAALRVLPTLAWTNDHMIVVEHSPQHFFQIPSQLVQEDQRGYGDTTLTFFSVLSNSAAST